MKKLILLALPFCAILVAALRWGGHQATGDPAATGVAFFIPPESEDFANIDVRDGQNRPIQRPEAREVLAALFRENLLDLAVFDAPHAARETMTQVESILHLINKAILTRLPFQFRYAMDAITGAFRRFVHNVHNLWISFSVDISVRSSQITISHAPPTAHPSPLRC